MNVNIIPLTGLPRSGSTLMMYLLNQNPIFEIYPDSLLTEVLLQSKQAVCDTVSSSQIYHGKLSECFYEFCRGGSNFWVNQLCTKDKILIDKSRGWMEDLEYFFKIFPNIKLIVQIRDLRMVVNSIEKSKNNSLFFNRRDYYSGYDCNGGDIHLQRIQDAFELPFLRSSIFGLKEISQMPKKYKNNLFISKYEDLKENPTLHMKRIYEFLELPCFEHNFENIEQTGSWNDNVFQPYGDHKIRSKLETGTDGEATEIREDIMDMVYKEHFWFYDHFYPELIK